MDVNELYNFEEYPINKSTVRDILKIIKDVYNPKELKVATELKEILCGYYHRIKGIEYYQHTSAPIKFLF